VLWYYKTIPIEHPDVTRYGNDQLVDDIPATGITDEDEVVVYLIGDVAMI
jgi:hypothetical protein